MIALKFASAVTLLTVAAGCQSTGSWGSDGQSRWSRNEAISRTYEHGNSVESPQSWSAQSNNDTSRTYTNGGPLEADDPSLRGYNDDTSRTYHYSGATTINEHGTYVTQATEKHPTTKAVHSDPTPVSSSSAQARH